MSAMEALVKAQGGEFMEAPVSGSKVRGGAGAFGAGRGRRERAGVRVAGLGGEWTGVAPILRSPLLPS